MKRYGVGIVGFMAFCVSCLVWKTSVASEIYMEVLKYPTQISKFSDFYVRVKIENNGKMPLPGCDRSEEKCLAVGWDFVDERSVMGLPRKNIVPAVPYGSYLLPGQSVEKSIRIPTSAEVGRDSVLSLYLIVREKSRFSLQEHRLKMALKDPPSHIKRRRTMIRIIVYGYLSLSLIILWLLLFLRKGQSH